MAWFKLIFCEDNGQPSFIRVIACILILTILINWTWHNVSQGVFVSLDVVNLLAILGLVTGKVIQKSLEKPGL